MNDWKRSNTQNFSWPSWKCFLYVISVFPAYFIFHHLNYPRNRAVMKAGIAIREPPSTYTILKVFTSCYWRKEVLEKMILVLEKSLIFFPKNSVWTVFSFEDEDDYEVRFYFKFFCKYFFKQDTLESFILLFLTRLTWLFLLKEVMAFSHQNYFCSCVHTTF